MKVEYTRIEPLGRSHELYAKGYRWIFTVEGQTCYFTTRERAEERLPQIVANMEKGFGGWNGVRIEDYESESISNDNRARIARAAEAKAMLDRGDSVEAVTEFTGLHKGNVYKMKAGWSWQRLKST